MKKHVLGLAAAPLIVAGVAGSMASPVFAEYGAPTPVVYTTCGELQNAVYTASGRVQLSIGQEECAINLVIPSGKDVLFRNVNLINDGGDTITVQEGGRIELDLSTVRNNTSGKAIVKNSGLTLLMDVTMNAENGAYTIINSGEINSLYLNATGFKVENTGTIRISSGRTDNKEEAAKYNTYCLNTECGSTGDPDFVLPTLVPVGYKTRIEMRNPGHMATQMIEFEDVDENDAIKIEGSTMEGYDFSASKVGTGHISAHNWWDELTYNIKVYNLESNLPNGVNDAVRNYLVDNYGNPEHWFGMGSVGQNFLLDALENAETISVELNVKKLADNKVTSADKEKIAAKLGGAKVLAYGDITLSIMASESGEIEKIEELDDDVTIKWGGLELGKAKEGYERKFYAVRVHDGKAEKIAAEVDKNGNLVFESNRFSTYAVAYEDVKVETPAKADTKTDSKETKESEAKADEKSETKTNEKKSEAGTPDTGVSTKDGDNAIISLIGCILTGIAVAFIAMPKIRKHLR